MKHLMADALLKVEFARPAIYRAAWSAWALAPAWGSAQYHRRRVADAVLGPR